MDRCEQAYAYHKQGYNCCQCVLMAFSDRLETMGQLIDIGAGFGGGAGTGELCGAVVGGIMVLSALTPMDPADPAGSKKRALALSRELQKRFDQRYGAVRCRELLAAPDKSNEKSPASVRMGLTKHCDIMIVSAVEIVEEMLAEQEK